MAASAALSADETHIWRSLLRLSDLLRFRIAADVRKVSDLSAADHSVLLHLAEADSGRMLQQDLASSMYWSKSRMSHQLARMQRRGLVARVECPTDARGAFVVLTETGRAAIERAAPAHVETVRQLVFEDITPGELAAVTALTARVLDRLQDTQPVR